MALLGAAAMLLWYDIVPAQIGEHDDWHTREHKLRGRDAGVDRVLVVTGYSPD